MYWRVNNVTPEMLMRMYGVHVALGICVIVIVLQFITRPDPKKLVNTQVKTDFDHFARAVTTHLLDSSYISVEQNTTALVSGELAPSVVQQLKQAGIVPNSMDEMKAQARTAADERRVCSVRIDSVNLGDPNQQGLVPVDVAGLVAIHSASGSEDPKQFRFKYLVGQNSQTQKPIVAQFQGQ